MILYPAIDLLDGKCVRLKQGSFDESTVYSEDPIAIARAFERDGAEYLHVVDLSGAKDPSRRQASRIGEIIRSTGLKVQTGGGLRSVKDALELLEAGAERVVLGSAAVRDPKMLRELIERAGMERVTLALDVRLDGAGTPMLALQGWKEQSSISMRDFLARHESLGISRVLCTDISRDGMMTGPNTELYARLATEFPKIEFQASGGIGSLDDLRALKERGIRSAIAGKAIYSGAFTVKEALAVC